MNQNESDIETVKRLNLIEEIKGYIDDSQLTGFLVTGSLAWGKNYAVTKDSDIDFYVIGPERSTLINTITGIPCIDKESLLAGKRMLEYSSEPMDTISLKTQIGKYPGSVYFFDEKSIFNLVNRFQADTSVFFNNLRQFDKPQTKTYKSFYGESTEFTTPIRSAINNTYCQVPFFLNIDSTNKVTGIGMVAS